MSERETINKILSCFPKGEFHHNGFFESDAEVFSYKGNKLLFTTDDFSSEDLFRVNNPFQLGKNLAIATISDILASGGDPLFYGHSMVVSEEWSDDFILNFSKGIAEVVSSVKANFLGGDLGKLKEWHYTGIVIGEVRNPLSRIGAKEGDIVYMTGEAGAGNLEAALYLYSDNPIIKKLTNSYKTKFHNRSNEAKVIREFASSCIDTSDGVFNGISTIASLNNCGYYLENVPILKEAKLASRLLGKPEEIILLGECGEYELLFTIPAEKVADFEKEYKTKQLNISRIGTIIDESSKTIAFKERQLNMHNFDISARSFEHTRGYLSRLVEFIKTGE